MFVERLNKSHLINFSKNVANFLAGVTLKDFTNNKVLFIHDFNGVNYVFLLNDYNIIPLNSDAIRYAMSEKNLDRIYIKEMAKTFGKEYIEKYKTKCKIDCIQMEERDF